MTMAHGRLTLLHEMLTSESASATRCIIFSRQHEREVKVEVEVEQQE